MTQEQNYFKASIVEQASYMLKLVEATNNTCPLLQKIDEVLSGFSQASLSCQSSTQIINSFEDHTQSLTNLIKTLDSAVETLKNNATLPLLPAHPSYANVAGNTSRLPEVSNTTNTNSLSTVISRAAGQPEYIQRIINCLTIAKKQVYVLFSPTDAKAPKERDGSAAQSLHSKLNTLLKPPTNDASAPADVLNPTICALRFTNHNTVLLEFDSANAVKKFGSINLEHHLLTTHICPSVVILPRSYRVILHFIPCTSSFDPQDPDHITQIKEDMNLPPPTQS